MQELHGQGGCSRGTNMGHSSRRLVTPLDHGVRGPAMPPYMEGAHTGSLRHRLELKGHNPIWDHVTTDSPVKILDYG